MNSGFKDSKTVYSDSENSKTPCSGSVIIKTVHFIGTCLKLWALRTVFHLPSRSVELCPNRLFPLRLQLGYQLSLLFSSLICQGSPYRSCINFCWTYRSSPATSGPSTTVCLSWRFRRQAASMSRRLGDHGLLCCCSGHPLTWWLLVFGHDTLG